MNFRLFQQTPRITAGMNAVINGQTMRITSIHHHWEPGTGHTATATLVNEALAAHLPEPIIYDQAEGATACARCCVPIAPDEGRWVFPNATLGGPDLLDLVMNVPGAGQVVVCNTCGPQLRGAILYGLEPGNSTINFKSGEDQ